MIINRIDDNGSLVLSGENTLSLGTKLELYGRNATPRFNLQAGDGTTAASFVGKPDKTLTWDGHDLAGSAIVAKSLGANSYIKYASGLIVQWGSTQIPPANTNVTIDFPISFTSVFRFTAMPYHNGSNNTYPVVIDVYKSVSSVTIKSSIAITQALEWLAIGY